MPYYIAEIRLKGIAEYLSVIEKIYSDEYRTVRTINQEGTNSVHCREKQRIEHEEKARKKYGPFLNKAIGTLKDKLNFVFARKKKVNTTPKKETWVLFPWTVPMEAVELHGRGKLTANSLEEMEKLLRKRGNLDLRVI
ncbi:MAG: hypothetical protein GWN31_05320 [Candidatus Thorarchaeota archaeon]|nr:hypothetical protein [Candidatus Thorarchaeota archaeon]NIW13348.1 hypothetical protein [Candidatus Thorarchaeota archaeon]